MGHRCCCCRRNSVQTPVAQPRSRRPTPLCTAGLTGHPSPQAPPHRGPVLDDKWPGANPGAGRQAGGRAGGRASDREPERTMHSPGRHKVKRGSTQAALPDPPARSTPRTTRPHFLQPTGQVTDKAALPPPRPARPDPLSPRLRLARRQSPPGLNPGELLRLPRKAAPGVPLPPKDQKPAAGPSRASRDGTRSRSPQESTDPPHRGALRAQHTDPPLHLLAQGILGVGVLSPAPPPAQSAGRTTIPRVPRADAAGEGGAGREPRRRSRASSSPEGAGDAPGPVSGAPRGSFLGAPPGSWSLI